MSLISLNIRRYIQHLWLQFDAYRLIECLSRRPNTTAVENKHQLNRRRTTASLQLTNRLTICKLQCKAHTEQVRKSTIRSVETFDLKAMVNGVYRESGTARQRSGMCAYLNLRNQISILQDRPAILGNRLAFI